MRACHNEIVGLVARVLGTLCLVVLAACATVTFKRGASPDAMSADERACREATSSDAAYAACLRERGVYVSSGAGGSAAAPAALVAEPRTGTGAAGATVEAVPPPPAEATADPPAAAGASAAAEPDAFARSDVASWWKLGAGPTDLDRSIDACVGKLGEAHRPTAGATTVTAGMRGCLRADGWYAVGGSATR